MTEHVPSPSPSITRIIIAIVAILFTVWLILPLAVISYTSSMEIAGQTGDVFNVANSLFTGFALVGVVYTLTLQQRDALKREEEFSEARQRSIDEIRLAMLNIRLQTTNILIEEYRKSVKELRPGLTVPISLNKLISARDDLEKEHDFNAEEKNEVISLLDEIIYFQTERLEMRQELEDRINE